MSAIAPHGLPNNARILVWLPSPMGDTIMCTPAIKALRQQVPQASLTLYGNPVSHDVLMPWPWMDHWLDQCSTIAAARQFHKHRFTHALLFKNSFASSLACYLGRIGHRIGYARDGRAPFLTQKLDVPRLPNGAYQPIPAVEYYGKLITHLGCPIQTRPPELSIDAADQSSLCKKLPRIGEGNKPLVILVPGGAFGPSKQWPAPNYARTAEYLINTYNAEVVLSISPHPTEQAIAKEIVARCPHPLINLGDTPVSLGQLKALIGRADLVIGNDTGPRHLAIALGRKVITLFGPTDPAWTETGYAHEIKILGTGPCVPCQKPHCSHPEAFCMETISIDKVCEVVDKML